MKEAVIVSTARTPIGRAFKGALNNIKSPSMMAHAISHAVARAGIDGAEVVNGPGGFSSSEIVANPKACVDPDVVRLRTKFGGRVLA